MKKCLVYLIDSLLSILSSDSIVIGSVCDLRLSQDGPASTLACIRPAHSERLLCLRCKKSILIQPFPNQKITSQAVRACKWKAIKQKIDSSGDQPTDALECR